MSQAVRCPLYDTEQVRQLEHLAYEGGQTELHLMEQAGMSAYQQVLAHYPHSEHFLILVGPGNNGGDALVLAMHALMDKKQVTLLVLDKVSNSQPTAEVYRRVQELNLSILTSASELDWQEYDLIVDGIFGIGLSKPLEGKFFDICQLVNQSAAPVVALDIPSGLHSDTGSIMGAAIVSDLTVTFIGMKKGMSTADGRDHCGRVEIEDLKLSSGIFKQVIPRTHLVRYPLFMAGLQRESLNTHKGMFGHVVVVGGDKSMGGAALLCAEAAYRAGAGRVSVLTHADHSGAFLSRLPEALCYDGSDLSKAAEILATADVVALGPGLGRHSFGKALSHLVMGLDVPMVVDADGLYWLAQSKQQKQWVLTPHPKEAGGLLGMETTNINGDRYQAASQIAKQYGGVCLLKGIGTIVTDGSDELVIEEGNAYMSVAGMGDVLTGMVAAFVGQGMSLMGGASTAAVIHGHIADVCSLHGLTVGLMPTDIIAYMHQAIRFETQA